MGGGFFVLMFIMYVLGLWYGVKFIVDSKVDVIASYLLFVGLIDVIDVMWGVYVMFVC